MLVGERRRVFEKGWGWFENDGVWWVDDGVGVTMLGVCVTIGRAARR